MTIKILGTGCVNCQKLEALAKQAVDELKIDAPIEKVKEINQIIEYGIARTPGLVINEEVKSAGKIPSLDQIKSWIQDAG